MLTDAIFSDLVFVFKSSDRDTIQKGDEHTVQKGEQGHTIQKGAGLTAVFGNWRQRSIIFDSPSTV